MKIPFVDLKAQYHSIKSEIDNAIAEVIDNTAFIGGSNNKFTNRFEENFAAYVGVKFCISCANGTDSIEILLKSIGVGAGDEVIVPSHSWISTSEAVGNVGAVPVFVDTLPGYYTIDPSKIEENITAKTKAIIPVHLYGLPAEMDEIMAIAQKHNLKVIEDCAQAHGAMYKGRKVGSIGHAASFSFYPGKNLGAYGDAGCMVTGHEAVASMARMISNHGQVKKHEHLVEGRNSRMDGIHAAILTAKLPFLDKWNLARIHHASIYEKYLCNSGIVFPVKPAYSTHVFHLYVIQVQTRDRIISKMKDAGIETAIHYPVILPLLSAYKPFNLTKEIFPVSYGYQDKIVSLPMFPELTENQVARVCEICSGS